MDTLTQQQELFAQAYVRTLNQAAAYREAYNVGPDTAARTVMTEAHRVATHPGVAARIRELQDRAAGLAAVPSLAERIKELRAIESADANEVIGVRWINCRYCRGEDHGFQWKDEGEYARACDDRLRLKQPIPAPPSDGCLGYNPTLPPVDHCPSCFGVGERVPWVADTSKLKGGAKLLYKGAKIKGNGDIEILLHDQMAAREMLNKIQGAYVAGNAAANPAEPGAGAKAAVAAKNPEERQRAYLRLMAT